MGLWFAPFPLMPTFLLLTHHTLLFIFCARNDTFLSFAGSANSINERADNIVEYL